MSDEGGIHSEDPFATPQDAKTLGRNLRGRLAHPVTIWTAGSNENPVGLTMSSVLVADGDPPAVLGLMAPATDLHEVILDTRRFVIHVLSKDDWKLAEIFAGLRPNPGGPFADLDVEQSDFGPVIAAPTIAFCSLSATETIGYYDLIRATIENLIPGDPSTPLLHYRGKYRSLLAK